MGTVLGGAANDKYERIDVSDASQLECCLQQPNDPDHVHFVRYCRSALGLRNKAHPGQMEDQIRRCCSQASLKIVTAAHIGSNPSNGRPFFFAQNGGR